MSTVVRRVMTLIPVAAPLSAVTSTPVTGGAGGSLSTTPRTSFAQCEYHLEWYSRSET